MKLGCVLTAAGNSSRFGEDKLQLPIDGTPMGIHALEVLSKVAFDKRVVVSSQDKRYLIQAAEARGFDVVINHAPERGMSSSVRLGTAHITGAGAYDGILYAVADQPHLHMDTVQRLLEAFEGEPEYIWAPAFQGRRGNPVIFPADLFEELLDVQGDRGGRQVVEAHLEQLRTIPVDAAELKDIDTKEDLNLC